MKRVLALTSAAFMATSMFASPVLADDAGTGGSVDASGSASAGADASGSVSGDTGTSISGTADTSTSATGTADVSGTLTGGGELSGSADATAAAEAESEASGDLTGTEDDPATVATSTEAGTAAEVEASGALTGAEAEAAPEEADTTAATATASLTDVDQAVSAIESSNTFATQISDVGEGATVSVVNIGSFTNIQNETTIENTINVQAANIANLQNAIGSNGSLVAALQANNVAVSSVVGASGSADQLVLYTLPM